MKITRVRITNYRGISVRDEQIGASGAIAKGRNAAGKTSFLRAIRAALSAQDVGADAIRLGTDKAEILVDLDDVTVRRVITAKSTSVTVTRDGFDAKKPQTMLTELLGASPLDPLDLFLAKPKERRAKVLEALPVKLTLEQLRKWADVDEGDLKMLGVDLNGHGLEALERVRQGYYDRRTKVNAAHAEAKREAERLRIDAESLGVPHGAQDVKTASAELDAARDEAKRLFHQAEAAEAARERTSSTRERIESLRAGAAQHDDRALALGPPDGDLSAAMGALAAAEDRVTAIEKQLVDARADVARATEALDELKEATEEAACQTRMAGELRARAAEVEKTLEDASIADVAPEEVARIAERVKDAERSVAVAKLAGEANDARARAAAATATAEARAVDADALDAIVKRLTNVAPAELLAQANGIPGLTVDGDDVVLDGVRLEALSGAEQMRFAIDVSKRLNAKSRILIVDGLERLDPEQMDRFVQMATSDGYQLIGTRVDRGDVVIEAIEAETAAAAE